MLDCVFCKIVKGELPSTVEFESDNIIAFKSSDPVAETHILVCPKKHIANFLEINDSGTIFEMTKAVQILVKEKKLEGGYKLVFNGGKYQFIPHLHWHLLAGKLEDEKDIINNT